MKKKTEHEVTLLREHTHQGEKCTAGSKITVSEPIKNWLIGQGVIAQEATPKTDNSPGGDQ